MARISNQDVRGLSDIISPSEFEFSLGSIPGYTVDRELNIKCQQAVYPGNSNEAYEVMLHGHSVFFRGKKTVPHQLSLTYVEDRLLGTSTAFKLWSEFVVGTKSGTSGGYKADYAIDGPQLITYDPTGAVIDTVTFYGVFPQDKPDVSYDSTSSQIYLVNVTLTYDYYESSLVTSR